MFVEQLRMAIDTNAVDAGEEGTPLLFAVRAERYNIIPALVAAGARAPAESSLVDAPLHELARRGRVEEMRVLLDAGAEPNCLNRDGKTPLHWAAMVGNVESCRLLVSYGADPFRPQSGAVKFHNYLTPFQLAIEKDEIAAVSYFIHECGADLGQKTVAGKSLLELARGQPRVTGLLLSLRAEVAIGAGFSAVGEGQSGGQGARTALVL
jgi:ankyrin repeat protein